MNQGEAVVVSLLSQQVALLIAAVLLCLVAIGLGILNFRALMVTRRILRNKLDLVDRYQRDAQQKLDFVVRAIEDSR